MSIEQISVEILNRQFTIGTPDKERDMLLKAVELLNQKIHVIQSAGLNMETEKVAIMAALNLTHDLLKAAEKTEKENREKNKAATALPNEETNRTIAELVELCDKTLKIS